MNSIILIKKEKDLRRKKLNNLFEKTFFQNIGHLSIFLIFEDNFN